MRPLLPILTALLLVACHKPPVAKPKLPAPIIDHNLRVFLGIQAIHTTFAVPESATGYRTVALMFADGKEVARREGFTFLFPEPEQHPAFGDIQLLWQSERGQFRRVAFVAGGNSHDLSDAFPHWPQFGSYSSRSVAIEENITYQGVRILGILASNPLASDGTRTEPQLHPTSETLPAAAKYVVAIGIICESGPEPHLACALSLARNKSCI